MPPAWTQALLCCLSNESEIMPISQAIEYAKIDDLYLDARNPRLGRHSLDQELSQNDIIDLMADWTLDELATSFIESGFWTQEAFVVVEEKIGGKQRTVVVEGNRRLAALKLLARAKAGRPSHDKWKRLAKSLTQTKWGKLKEVPIIRADKRTEVQSYLGFRHVTGIKEWNPAEKAEFISLLIDTYNLSYEQVRRRIGSKLPTVRQNYISYRLLLQMEDRDDIYIKKVEERFSVLYLSLRTQGVQKYLQIDIKAEPGTARKPVPRSKLLQLANFACWLFGTEKLQPIVRDSRQTDDFGQILESPKAVRYLEDTKLPSFDTAFRIAGGDEAETSYHVESAAYSVEEALKTAHHHKKSTRLQSAVKRLARDTDQLLEVFPTIYDELYGEDE